MKPLAYVALSLGWVFALLVPSAETEILYDREGIQRSPDILGDTQLHQAERLMQEKDPEGAKKTTEELLALQQEHGLEIDPEGAQAGKSGIRGGETMVFDEMEFVGIPPGEFQLGSTSGHTGRDEKPVTRVRSSRGFYLGKYEVTQAQWRAVMGTNPSGFKGCGGDCPVERVSWEDVQVFIGRLNARSRSGRYRLPTEAEWEYAARAGTSSDTYAGDISEPLSTDPVVNGIAWYRNNSGRRTHPVGRKAPNGWGLYDMLGNVGEWVGDWYGSYPGGAVTDPAGPGSGSRRVSRGGSWRSSAGFCRSALRGRISPGTRLNSLGFRLLRVVHPHKLVFKGSAVDFTVTREREQAPATDPSDKDSPRPRTQLPPNILADKYLREAEQLVEDKDPKGARKAMEELLALQQLHSLEPNPEDYFRYAKVWSAGGVTEQAIEAAMRYLQLQGRQTAHYNEALDLLDRVEAHQTRSNSSANAPERAQPGSTEIRGGETMVFDGMEFVGISPGEFLMGANSRHSQEDERPVTRVRISRGFYLGKYEVTQAQWQVVMGTNPSYFRNCGSNCPVERVSWKEVQVFIGRLNELSGAGRYRLPTEAEWEYAARAGTLTDTHAGNIVKRFGNDPVVNGIAWYRKNSDRQTHPVGQKAPNGWGLYDMLGNVREWVRDRYGSYPGRAVTDPAGLPSGWRRVFRGGSVRSSAWTCRSSERDWSLPSGRNLDMGFRLLREE